MRTAFILYRLGSLGVLLSFEVFFEEPLAGSLRQNPTTWMSLAILFGYAGLCGIMLLSARLKWLREGNQIFMFVTHGFALVAILWLLLWCFDWLAIMINMGDRAEMFIKHTSDLHLFGVGFSMAGYVTGWMASNWGERSARFLMTIGWAVSYMAWFNLFFQPALKWLWAPAVGGLLVVIGAFLISQQLKRDFEAASSQA